MSESIKISTTVPAPPKKVYEAWLDSKEHSAFTGEKATGKLKRRRQVHRFQWLHRRKEPRTQASQTDRSSMAYHRVPRRKRRLKVGINPGEG